MNPQIQFPRDPSTPVSHLPFSPVCVVPGGSALVFISGQASVDATGQIIRGSFEEEFRRSLENVKAVLAAAGCTLADVIQTRNYVDLPADLPAFNQLYREYFQAPYPTRTTIVNCLGGALRYEVEVVAVKPTVKSGGTEA